MIDWINCDLETFKFIQFGSGLNLLLADKSNSSQSLDSRNAVGKSSLVEIVDFLLGSKADKKKTVVQAPSIANATFSMQIRFTEEEKIVVSRSPAKRTEIWIQGDVSRWPIEPKFHEESGQHKMHIDDWRKFLGHVFFNLPLAGGSHPSFRELFPYWARRDRDGGFAEVTRHNKNQQVGSKRLALSYLFELDWQIARRFELLRVEEQGLEQLRKNARKGLFDSYIQSSSRIRPELGREERRLANLTHQLANFKVVDEYEILSKEANRLSQELSTLNKNDLLNRKRLSQIETDLRNEDFTDQEKLHELYQEAGVVLPNLVKNRFKDVLIFHQKVVSNRQQHLSAERAELIEKLTTSIQQKTNIDERRADVMKLISAGGALDTFTEMQAELARATVRVEELKLKLSDAVKLEQSSTEMEARRLKLTAELQADISERQSTVIAASNLFSEIYEKLRSTTANLIVGTEKNGPQFETQADDQGSRGVHNTLIFAFDFTMAVLWSKKEAGPGFVIHDSHLFADMDERQASKALQVAIQICAENDLQYIVTMNSDAIPADGLDESIQLSDHVMPVRLTDSEDGGLFGFQFSYLEDKDND